ncbi:MAG: tetratricopeptide repeat protein [Proteobacteria bacterium]|nr:tetratricopeptide repeat protein [Pseudomonadota bacterium]
MKKQSTWIFLLLIFIFCLAGCTRGKTISSPLGLGKTSENTAGTDESKLSAAYFYLESRIHAQNDELPQAIVSLEKAIKRDPDSAFLKRDLIGFYIEQKKEDQALALAQTLADQYPENVDTLLLLVRLMKKTDSKTQLPGLLKKILTLDPGNKETYLRLGQIYMDNGNLPEALDLFTRMAKQFPDYYVAQFYLGETHLLLNNHDPAEAAFLKTIELEPELVEPRFRLIEIYEKQKKKAYKDKILESYEKILEIEPENDRAVLEMALFQYKNNQKAEASQLFLELGRQAVENSRIVMAAVDTFITDKRYTDAVIVFSQMLKADPENANFNFFTGMAYEAVENFNQAIAHYLKVTPEHPQYKKTLLSIAFLYRDMEKPEQAIRLLEQHHDKNPKDIDILSYLASFYEDQAQYDKTIEILEKGLRDAPDNPTLLFRLGAVQDKADLKDQSIQTMKTLIEIDPENASALNYLGYTYADMGIHLEEALALISRALEQKPEDSYITDSMGWVYYQMKDYEKAIHYLEKAARLSNFETIIAGHLADAYVKAGQMDTALAMYKKALTNAKKEDDDLTLEIKEKIKGLEKNPHEK